MWRSLYMRQLRPTRRTRSSRRTVDSDPDDASTKVEDVDMDVDVSLKASESEGEGEDDDDDEGEEEEEMEEEEQVAPEPPPERPRLKIKLRLPTHPSSASNAASTPARTPAPDDLSRPPSRSRDPDVESEEDAEGAHSRSTPSNSVAGTSTRPMTTRQAVLASVVDPTHVSLETSRKKKPLNDAEIALRREETARKRKNMTEKKLEDEKVETINRLLKKQSRPKNKRSALSTAEDRSPQSQPSTGANTKAASTPVPQSLLKEALTHAAAERELEDGTDADMAVDTTPPEEIPTMYRWVSRTVSAPSDDGQGVVKSMALSFSVPISVFEGLGIESAAAEDAMQVDQSPSEPAVRPPARCDVEGCTESRKYKMVKDWTKGACGMAHLKYLEKATSVV